MKSSRKSVNITVDRKVFNSCYLPYLTDESKFLVFYGGAGSGKSFFIAQRYIFKLLKNEMCNILTVRQVGDTNRDSTFALFVQVINKWGLSRYFKINASLLKITCLLNKNSVIFKGLDNVEKLKSITFAKGELTDIWVEEASEADEESINQLIVRLRGGKSRKQIVLSFNPISVNHWLKKRFFDLKPPGCRVLHTTYRDNRFLDEEYRETLEGFRDIDPYYYAVYCLGQWGVYGKTVFNAVNIQIMLDRNIMPVKQGEFICNIEENKVLNFSFEEKEDGFIKIYEEPKEGHFYVLGGDTAGEGSDWFTGHIIDNEDGRQVAVLRHNFDEDIYSEQMFCLGKIYNNALIGVEINYSTFPQKRLQQLGYKNFYIRERQDTYTGKLMQAFGFKTTPQTRPPLIAELVRIMRDEPQKVVDRETLLEMLTFVRNEKGRPEAQAGSHDDLIMGLGIVHQIRNQQERRSVKSDEEKKAVWSDDYWEDYNNADEETRDMLIRLRGNPF